MNIFNKVTLQMLKKNKSRTIVTVIGIILSVALICAVTTFISSMLNYALDYSIYNHGDWHGAFYDVTWQDYNQMNGTEKLSDSTFGQRVGYAQIDSKNAYKPYLYVMGGEKDNFFNTLPVHLTSGKLPQNSNEIILPEHLASNGGLTYKIGDTITLEIGDRFFNGRPLDQDDSCFDNSGNTIEEVFTARETRTYTVVGFYERPDFEVDSAPGYTALTVADAQRTADTKYDMYFKMHKATNVYGFVMRYDFDYAYNTDVLMFSGISKYSPIAKAVISMATVVMGLIMFGSVALIFNAFSISVSERTKQFGLLSSIGATKKQLKKMVLFEAFAVSVVAIPIGIGVGIAGITITLLLIGNKFASLFGTFDLPMRVCVSWQSVVVAVIVGIVTVLLSAWLPSRRATKVSAVEAIRQTGDIKAKNKQIKTSKLTYKLFGLPGVLASKHYKRNKSKYRTTVISLFMSIVLFISASAFSDYLMEIAHTGINSVGHDLSMQVSGTEFENITPEELLNQMKNGKSVTNGAYTVEHSTASTLKTEQLTAEGSKYLDRTRMQGEEQSIREAYTNVIFVDDATFKALLKENGLSEEKYMNPANPLGIVVDGLTRLNMYTQKYEKTTIFNTKEPQFLIQHETEDGWVDTNLQAGAVINKNPYFLRNTSSDAIHVIYPISFAQKVFPDFDSAEMSHYFMLCSENPAESYDSVQSILSNTGFNPKSLKNIAEEEETERNIITIVQVFSFGFIVMISLIAAANVFNTISTNINLRRREFAMLKSVGMTQKGFNRMMNFECLLYGSKALLYGLPVSAAMTYWIFKAVSGDVETTFHLPWNAIGIAVLCVFLVVFVTMMYSMRKIKKDNPIDALKNENL